MFTLEAFWSLFLFGRVYFYGGESILGAYLYFEDLFFIF